MRNKSVRSPLEDNKRTQTCFLTIRSGHPHILLLRIPGFDHDDGFGVLALAGGERSVFAGDVDPSFLVVCNKEQPAGEVVAIVWEIEAVGCGGYGADGFFAVWFRSIETAYGDPFIGFVFGDSFQKFGLIIISAEIEQVACGSFVILGGAHDEEITGLAEFNHDFHQIIFSEDDKFSSRIGVQFHAELFFGVGITIEFLQCFNIG